MQGAELWRVLRTPLTLLVLLGILAFGAYWGYTNVMKPPPPPPVEPCVPQEVGEQLESSQVSVRVFNGGAERGKAAEVGQALEAAGFVVESVGNTDEPVTVTTVVGVSADDPAVRLTLEHFKKAEARPDNRPDGIVDVLIGSAYAGMHGDAPEAIELETESVCLPASSSPSPAG
ncbi:LytR family transcriptional regulator [Auraticoccus sp. F435]|uniref:LytR family transcriptional regulator n=1 Tax=Auraticoccus cholistanensis TaxID=2656650 RepID=A0A6A9UUJ4_9ACTN|nr:LytR C-terminal domain-containing protein [Auraticoccus cholistanensis]MVA74877.1 LytR family transcriptional regulator [Auraticoccus cholistanensis]